MPTELLAGDEAGVARAAFLLREGALVAFGTETVYGLGADATNARAVAALFAAKGRPAFNPLICHYLSADAAFADVMPCEIARRLAGTFWPGPLTLVLPRRSSSSVVPLAAAGLPSLAVRVPAHPLARKLLAAAARPIAAPSANRSGRVSPTTASHVLAELDGLIAAILDCGPAIVGLESTVIDLAGSPRGGPRLLRPGGVTSEAIRAICGPLAAASRDETPTGPGMLASHYAPRLPLRLDAASVSADEALLAFGPPLRGAGALFQLSEAGDLTEAGARLFAGLRSLDAEGMRLGLARIAAMPIPQHGLGQAINDRLRRAAAPRPGSGCYPP
ncbi:MAG TPA: L-threonylcarbamoyladenylate synthase [Acetobacteraceae bacterium]|nr:L-threonylcarbamoyladenylate synthase [Acetobacteraceae bacterium]